MLEAPAAITDWIQTWAQPIGSFGSLFLSAALVALYFQQKNLLRESYNADHRAVVEVEDYEVEDDRLILQLSNVGNGVGTDLELITATVFEKTDEFAPSVTTSRVKLSNDEVAKGRQSIKPHEDNVSYVTRPTLGFEYTDGEIHRQGYRLAMRKLKRTDIEVLRVHLFLRYQDLREKFAGEHITGIEVDVDSEITSLEALHSHGGLMVHGSPTVNPETLEMDLTEAATSNQRTIT